MDNQPRLLRTLALATASLIAASALVFLPTAAQADTAPAAATTPSTVSSDALPTVQVDGVVWSQVVIGNTVYAAGSFTSAQPSGAAAGVNVTPRANMLAYNLTTGVLITTFAPSFNAQVRGLAASPDGKTVYAVGNFTQVNGVNASRIAALDATTGALNTSFAATAKTNGAVYSVVATTTAVYFGGSFTTANAVTRTRAAAVSATTGALLPWAPAIPDHIVRTMVASPDGSKIVLGGDFMSVNGNTSPGAGLAEVDATSGASLPFAAGITVSDSGDDAAIMNLSTDGTNIYGVGYIWAGIGGNLEGAFSAKWSDGSITWVEDCHGDSYSVAALGDVVYTVSHAHDCARIDGGFPSTSTHQHALAFTKAATGTLGSCNSCGQYANWGGTPSPTLLTWYPDMENGTATGQNQAAWSVVTASVGANSGYVLLGGEFPTVNGKRQTGLVRFATKDLAPNTDGPRVSGANWPSTSISLASGTARVSWVANYDRDNANLTYTVYRSGVTAPVYTTTATSLDWWSRPSLGFIDTGLTAGATYTYKVKATDPFGNTVTGGSSTVTVAGAATADSPYAAAVKSDGALDVWRLGEATSGTAYNSVAFNDLAEGTGVTVGTSGAIVGDTNTAATFSGDSTGTASSITAIQAPDTFTEEAWFKTTSTAGGKIIGLGDTQTGSSGSYDRQVYMGSDGTVTFGVYTGSTATLQSAAGLNDGAWHSVVATMSSSGMALYIDGARVGARSDVTAGQAYKGYWRIGSDNLNGWPNASGTAFAGSIDDVAVYPTALSYSTVRSHWNLAGYGTAAPTDVYGKAVYNDLPDLFWRLDDAAGETAVSDASGNKKTGLSQGGVTFGTTASAIAGAGKTAATFDGSSGTIASKTTVSNPTNYTEELWFKSRTKTGGKLIGLGDHQTGNSGDNDRNLSMLDTGQLQFGTWTGVANLTTSPASYNDGSWHHAVVTQGSDGTTLFVDGAVVATSAATGAQNFTGYWRVGGDTVWSGTTSAYFNGSIDDVAVYSTELTAAQVATHYSAGASANTPPVAAFSAAATTLSVAFDASASTDSDGTVSSYTWDFGDGSTAAASSATTTSHTYAVAGKYPVSLTVKDNQGATSTVQKTVTVVAPNVAPTAAFTASASNLVESFDGSNSKDPDGTIASYVWDFGDGASGTGVAPSHTYVAAGSYTVKLTVTDNAGAIAIAIATAAVTVTAPAAVRLAQDAFGRTVASGFGTADVGGAWVVSSASLLSVGSGVAAAKVAAGSTVSAYLGSVSSTATNVATTVTVAALPAGGSLFAGVVGRRIGSDDYNARLAVVASGAVTLSVLHAGTSLKSVTLTGVTATAGSLIHVRLVTTGSGTTTLKARAWVDGTAEPTTWQVTSTDTTAALQAAGSVGIRSYLGSGATNGPLTVKFDDFTADTAQ